MKDVPARSMYSTQARIILGTSCAFGSMHFLKSCPGGPRTGLGEAGVGGCATAGVGAA
jgi:hypothetical protein